MALLWQETIQVTNEMVSETAPPESGQTDVTEEPQNTVSPEELEVEEPEDLE